MKISEQEIPSLIKQGKDKIIIPELYKKVFPTVKKYIVKNRGIEDDALDVFQDAILYFYKQVVKNEFDEKYAVYGYLFRLSVNRWLNKIKRDKKMILSDEIREDSTGFHEFIMEEKKESVENENLIQKFFSGVGEKCVELLTYTVYYNLMAEDIVIRMGFTSEGAVKMKLKRCREKLFEEAEKNPSLIEKLREI